MGNIHGGSCLRKSAVFLIKNFCCLTAVLITSGCFNRKYLQIFSAAGFGLYSRKKEKKKKKKKGSRVLI